MSHPTKLAPLVEIDVDDTPSRNGGRSPRPSGGGFRVWMNGSAGRFSLVSFFVVVIAFAAWRLWSVASADQPQWPRIRVMNAETGELRWFRTGEGKTLPDGFHPIEYCFQDGCGPAGGTPVVLNVYLGKKDPTRCPKCGALVVGHNPRPSEYVGVIPAAEKN